MTMTRPSYYQKIQDQKISSDFLLQNQQNVIELMIGRPRANMMKLAIHGSVIMM